VYFSTVAHLHPATIFAVPGGIIECFGGIALAVGLFGRLAAAGLVGDMVIAMITVTLKNGIVSNAAGSGYELNVALAALALVVAILGTGRLSLDHLVRPYALKAIRRRDPNSKPGRQSLVDHPVSST
jgi:uncharacterized membrane protein YphA (DoxX/SURF4 family)